jgi:excisionase family DNA binding protein
MDEQRLLTATEVASRLGLARSRVHTLIAEGSLPTIRVGKRARVPVAALEAWVKRNTAGSPPPDGK